MLEKQMHSIWYGQSGLTALLRPVSWLFCLLVLLRRGAYRFGLLRSVRLPVPVIVVGNISVGGTGKTPLVIEVVNILKQAGFKPGVISRGYGGKARSWPQQVRSDCDPVMVGDEPIVIAKRTQVPMAVGPDRVATGRALLEHFNCDIIVSDDGLQHYALKRDIEIVVVDGMRRFGNGLCLPAGPLREPQKRVDEVDLVVNSGSSVGDEYQMRYLGDYLVNLKTAEKVPLSDFTGKTVHAAAGVGNPERFFNQLRDMGIKVIEHPFPDHYYFKAQDLCFNDDHVVIMTEKDAVKFKRYADANMWYWPIDVELKKKFNYHLLNILEMKNGQKAA